MNGLAFGSRLKQLRVGLNLKQKEFADYIGISNGALSEIESGKRFPPFDAFISIYEYLREHNICIDWLLTGEGEPASISPAQPPEPTLTETEDLLLEEYRAADKQKRKAILQAALGTSHEPRGETL
jgi:transcriptional regulator with XRE-family HTH domain